MGCCTSASGTQPSATKRPIPAPPSPEECLLISVGADTDIGGANKKENQDVYLVHSAFMDEPSRHLFGVMDGHGSEGRRASMYCRQTLPAVLECIYDGDPDSDNVSGALRRSFEETHERVSNRSKSRCDASHSGTTATVALLEHKELMIAWVGDSQACIIKESLSGELTCSWQSRVHQFNQEDEKQRSLQAGGWVDQSRSGGFPSGPLRVYFKGEGFPGLMVSLSLGDSDAHRIGVAADPECYSYTLQEDDRYIVICSDGVWDVLNCDNIIELMRPNGNDMQEAAKKIVSRSKTEWAKPWHHGKTDNITAVCARINFPAVRVIPEGASSVTNEPTDGA